MYRANKAQEGETNACSPPNTLVEEQHSSRLSPDGLQLQLDDTLLALERLRPEWEALEQDSKSTPDFFQSYAWCYYVAAMRLRRATSDYRICVATIRQADDRLIGLWPLSIQRQGFCQIARNLDAPFGQFAGLLLHDPQHASICIKTVVDSLKLSGKIDGLQIGGVRETSALSDALHALGARVTRSDLAVDLDFRPFASFDDYHRTVAVKTRKNLRNAKNRLSREYEDISHQVIADVGPESPLIANTFDDRLTWMELGGKTTPAFRDPDFRPLLEGLPKADPPLQLLGFEFKTKSDIISAQWGFRHKNRYYAYMSARNLDFDRFSPGQVHLGMVIKASHDLNIEVIEMMAPASDYKLKWTKATKRLDDVSLTLTPKGFLYLNLWRGNFRKLFKWVFEHIPDRARQAAASWTNRNR